MRHFMKGCIVAILGGLMIYGGWVYITYVAFHEAVIGSWKNRNYLASQKLMDEFERSIAFRGLSLLPRYRDAFWYRKAWLKASAGRFDEAKKIFSSLGNSPHGGADARFAFGVLSLNSQDLSVSKEAFQKALMQDPHHHRARVDLELLLIEKERQDAERSAAEDKKKNRESEKQGPGRPGDQFRFRDLPGQQSGAGDKGLQY